MASSKQRRKQVARFRKEQQAGLPPRPPKDGDRRRRGSDLGRLVEQRKRAIRDWNIDSIPIEATDRLAADPLSDP